MSSGTVVAAGAGRTFRFGPNAAEVKASGADGLRLGFFQSSIPRDGGMKLLHVHRSYDEAFAVVAGTVEFRLDEETVRASAGDAVLVPAGVAHCFRNPDDAELQLVVMTAPAAGVDMVAELAALPPSDTDGVRRILAAHDSELLDPRPFWPTA